MSIEKQKIVLVSASPKTDQDWAVSAYLSKRSESSLLDDNTEVSIISVRHALMHHDTEKAYATMSQADSIILVFPLYFFCMPAMLTRFMQDFAVMYPAADRRTSVYAIVNCGFPEPEINREAMRVVECFAQKTGRLFGGGVMAGCGGMLLAAKDAPFVRPIFEQIDAMLLRVKHDYSSSMPVEAKVASVSVKFPRALYFFAGNAGWKSMARKNHLKPNDMYQKPYENK